MPAEPQQAQPQQANRDGGDMNDDDEQAAIRAFLQRCEVRLSTIHRVATALLSGAGILVLLPALQRDAIETVLRSLLSGRLTAAKGLLATCVSMSIGLALALLWLVVKQLTQFYFHANHIRRDGSETFTPRFTLTGLRLATNELGAASTSEYDDMHAAQSNVELLVPPNRNGRGRIDRQLDAYPALQSAARTDADRVEALLELAASRRRTLLEEVVKVELGLARHLLRLQVVVLRYVKALLVVVVTVTATYIASASISEAARSAAATTADQRWIAATFCIWAPTILMAVTAPVRWIEGLLRAEGATSSSVRDDPEFTHVEDIASFVALGVWLLATASLITLLITEHASTRASLSSGAAIVASVALLGAGVARWRRHESRRP